MSERKQRTPAEIIAETEAKLSRLLVKQAKQEAMSNPAITPLVAELDALRIEIREAKKGLGDGPQSFNARIAKHDAWITKIEEEKVIAYSVLNTSQDRKAEIELEIADAVNQVVEAPKEISAGA
tara:strand:+ start:159 stop:530 length:372 start_codon:yes stop_codon:yes gene_type:complete